MVTGEDEDGERIKEVEAGSKEEEDEEGQGGSSGGSIAGTGATTAASATEEEVKDSGRYGRMASSV